MQIRFFRSNFKTGFEDINPSNNSLIVNVSFVLLPPLSISKTHYYKTGAGVIYCQCWCRKLQQ